MTTTRQYDKLNRLLQTASVPSASGQSPVAFGYAHNRANQRARVSLADGSYWLYRYDRLGQVTSGKRYWQDHVPVAGQQFEYAFDDIGNRFSTKAGGDASGGSLRTTAYATDAANAYTERTVPGAVDILGLAGATAVVTVNSGANVYRRGEYYQKTVSVDNDPDAVLASINVTATVSGQPPQSQTGNYFVPGTPEAYAHDADGNLWADGRWVYGWDAESRLVEAEMWVNVPDAAKRRLEFTYDDRGRRIRKKVFAWVTGQWQLAAERKFLYDGWNLVSVLDGSNNRLQTFVWGLDLSGTLQGAGGVGGLVAMTDYQSGTAGTYFYAHDGNGNVVGLVNAADGSVVATYEYGPFGEVIRATGPLARVNPFRFSTKYQDEETGFLYYGYRYYNPSTGRWLSRDPLGEAGGRNLYGFIGNHPIDLVDFMGLALYAFDGTNNDGENDPYPTNVKILYDIYREQKRYLAGVGTHEPKKWQNVLGSVGGYGGAARIEDMLNFLRSQVQSGDKNVDVIGFSRGAAMAREFVNRIKDEFPCVRVRFLGLFDTVASFGVGGNDVDIGYRLGVSDNVDTVMHITSRDERRYFFPLSSILSGSRPAYPPYGSDWWEFSLPGVHSDIGGGYGDRRQFANRALEIMHQQAVARGVPFGPIPSEYRDTDTTGLRPHDSRWVNDWIGDYLNRRDNQPPRPREIYYSPWQ